MRRAVDDLPTLQERVEPARGPGPTELSAPEPEPQSIRPQTLGRYRLLFPIARGGMGTVHAAVLKGDAGVDRTFAVKVLRSQDRGPEEIEALIGEARLTTMISHPNVLETFELGMVAGEPFIVMPLVKGVTLAKLASHFAKSHEPFPPRLAAWIGAEVAAGLHAAHEATNVDGAPLGVVHRDVSPQNILLSFDGRVLLLDFGVAKFFESARTTESGVVKGKFGYMSPEQLRCDELDGQSDVFALGVVLFELCTGRPLYGDLPPAVAALRIVSEPTPRLSDRTPGAPAPLEEALFRAMAKSKGERFATARELRDALRAFLKTDPGEDLDLGELLRTIFSEARRELDSKIGAALRNPSAGAVEVEAAAFSSSSRDDAAPSSTRAAAVSPVARAKPGRSRTTSALATAGVLGLVAATWALTRGEDASRVPGARAPAANVAVVASFAPAPQERLERERGDTEAAASPSATATATATAEVTPSAAVQPSGRPAFNGAAPRPVTAPSATAASSTQPEPPRPAPTPSVGGTPFRAL